MQIFLKVFFAYTNTGIYDIRDKGKHQAMEQSGANHCAYVLNRVILRSKKVHLKSDLDTFPILSTCSFLVALRI